MQELAATAINDADAFYARLSDKMEKRYKQDSSELQKEYDRLAERNQNIDDMFLNLYSDEAKGIVTEQRFIKLTEGLEDEQKENDGRMEYGFARWGKTDGYYHVLKNAVDNNEYEISAVATTNYNKFIAEILKCEIAYLNGSTEIWYDPYLNRLGTHSELETEENHILVPLMFTQSGTKTMTSIDMSIRYVRTYNEWKVSDAIVVVGFGFGTDDEHINGILRTLIDIEDKKLFVVTLGYGESEEDIIKMVAGKLKVSKNRNIKILQVDKNGKVCGTGISWSEAIKSL